MSPHPLDDSGSGLGDPLDGVSPQQLHDFFWRHLHETGKWESNTRTLIDELLQPGDLFVDIGAWIGPVTLWALERGSRVIAIEPDPVALVELRRRVPSRVEIWEGAVAVQSGTASLIADEGRFGMSGSRLAGVDGVKVRTWTLPEILAGRRPKLVKIDIEGYEIELLPTIAPYLADLGASLQVALHGTLPKRDWLTGYRNLHLPADPHGTMVAEP